MSKKGGLKGLATRKLLLVAESEVNRQVLIADLNQIRARLGNADALIKIGRTAYPVFLSGARMVRWLFLRRDGKAHGLLRTIIEGWRLVRVLKPLWVSFMAPAQSQSAAQAGVANATPTNHPTSPGQGSASTSP